MMIVFKGSSREPTSKERKMENKKVRERFRDWRGKETRICLCYFCLTSQFSQLYTIYNWVQLAVTTVTVISQSLAQHTAGTLTNFLTNVFNKSLTYSAPQFSHTQHHTLSISTPSNSSLSALTLYSSN